MSGFEICQEVKKVSALPIILRERRKDKDIVEGYRN
jgi:DNA-binding response OmpR family regulator